VGNGAKSREDRGRPFGAENPATEHHAGRTGRHRVGRQLQGGEGVFATGVSGDEYRGVACIHDRTERLDRSVLDDLNQVGPDICRDPAVQAEDIGAGRRLALRLQGRARFDDDRDPVPGGIAHDPRVAFDLVVFEPAVPLSDV
jgi:hypothetical protein